MNKKILKNIIIFGSGNTSRVVIDIAKKENKYKIVGLIDNFNEKGIKLLGYEVIGDESNLNKLIKNYKVYGGLVAVGDNYLRFKIVQNIKELCPNFNFVKAVHPSSIISSDVMIGDGSIIVGGVIINSNANIGNHCFLNTNSSIDHGSIMEDFSSIAPGVAIGGDVIIHTFSAISLGANVINRIRIGEHSVIGAGSTVLNDIPSFVVAYGTPCKVVRSREKGEKYF